MLNNLTFGQSLSHDDCWNLYKDMIQDNDDYDTFEARYSLQDRLAADNTFYAHLLYESNATVTPYGSDSHNSQDVFTNIDAAYDQMEKDSFYEAQRDAYEMGYPRCKTEEQYYYKLIYDTHHVDPNEKEPEPSWKQATDRITSLLNSKPSTQ